MEMGLMRPHVTVVRPSPSCLPAFLWGWPFFPLKLHRKVVAGFRLYGVHAEFISLRFLCVKSGEKNLPKVETLWQGRKDSGHGCDAQDQQEYKVR